jgi:hypothetical protein
VAHDLLAFTHCAMEKYGSGLELQEILKAKEQINNVYGLLQRIKSIADKTPPPDKLTMYPGWGTLSLRERSLISTFPGEVSVTCPR